MEKVVWFCFDERMRGRELDELESIKFGRREEIAATIVTFVFYYYYNGERVISVDTRMENRQDFLCLRKRGPKGSPRGKKN